MAGGVMSGRTLDFEQPPEIPLHKLLLARKPGLKPGEDIPRLEAHLRSCVVPTVPEYRAVCGLTAGPLPILFPQILAEPLHLALASHPEMPLPAMGLVHVRQSVAQVRPILEGEEVSISCWLEGQRPARRGIEADIHTALRDEDNTVIWRGVSTVLSKHGPGDGLKRQQPEQPPLRVTRSAAWAVPSSQGRQYARVSGDWNPIHTTALTAKLFGFKRAIAHGMWTLARALGELDEDLPTENVGVTASFRRPVFLPSRVLFESGDRGDALGFEVREAKSGRVCISGEINPLVR